ncbi:MAG: HD domain-containing protein [Synergistetes bacterium]|nr:HD domain-containing protein [Synergistota bacterium]
MKCVPVTRLEEGMVVGKTVYTSDGRPLLRRGMVLEKRHIERLLKIGIPVIYIEEKMIEDIKAEDLILDKVRTMAIQEARRIVLKVRREGRFYNRKISEIDISEDLERVKSIVNSLLQEVFRTKQAVYSFIDIRSLDDFLYGHMVNTTVLGMMTGLTLGYKTDKLFCLGLGLFMHDIGKAFLDDAILSVQKLLEEEKNPLIRRHPVTGYELLKNAQGVSLLSAHVVYQHHERLDGKGYPRGLSGSQIHELAKVAAVVNVYDILVSGSPFQSRVKPNEAVEALMAMSGTFFDKEIVEAFLKNVAVYPIGTTVRLSTGEIAVVSQVKRGLPMRPVVKIIKSSEGKELDLPVELDLSTEPSITIEEVIE